MSAKLLPKKKFIIYAPGVHTGGGLLLLKLIINSFPKNIPLVLFIDKKIFNLINVSKNIEIFWIKPNLLSRLYFEYKLFLAAKKNDTILTFTSMPPLFKLRGYVINFHQNLILIQKSTHKIFSKKKS